MVNCIIIKDKNEYILSILFISLLLLIVYLLYGIFIRNPRICKVKNKIGCGENININDNFYKSYKCKKETNINSIYQRWGIFNFSYYKWFDWCRFIILCIFIILTIINIFCILRTDIINNNKIYNIIINIVIVLIIIYINICSYSKCYIKKYEKW